uniref:Uncharacterized protein n=1 Tax=Biomphalaria glabrata TaxID=6526 RepID=A0A2C9LZ74_BIOGL
MNSLAWITSLVLLTSVLLCAFGDEETSYSCFSDEQCSNASNASNFFMNQVKYCCKAGDKLVISAKGKNFHYKGSSFVHIEKRDAQVEALPEEEIKTSVNCTCSSVDPKLIEEEAKSALEKMQQEFKSDNIDY